MNSVAQAGLQTFLAVICSLIASSGFWAMIAKRYDKKDTKTDMLVGLGHDRITSLGLSFINRGFIYEDEYENLHDYLYKPYAALGGNGSAKRIMEEVNKLPIRTRTYTEGGKSL